MEIGELYLFDGIVWEVIAVHTDGTVWMRAATDFTDDRFVYDDTIELYHPVQRCTRCREVLPMAEFRVLPTRGGRRRTDCHGCERAAAAARHRAARG